MSMGFGQSGPVVGPGQLKAYLQEQGDRAINEFAPKFLEYADWLYKNGLEQVDKLERKGNIRLDQALNEIGSDNYVQHFLDPIQESANKLEAFTPGGLNAPGGFGFSVNPDGTVNMQRGADFQKQLDQIGSAYSGDELAYNELLQQISPGFGKLSEAMIKRLQGERDTALSDLQNQFANRRVLGSSFADQEEQSERERWANAMAMAEGQAIVQEMDMTKNVLGQRTDSRMKYITAALQQLQFEGGMGASIQQGVMSTMASMKQAAANLMTMFAQARAEVAMNTKLARAGLLSNQYMGLLNNVVGAQMGLEQNVVAERNLYPQYSIETLWNMMNNFGNYAANAQQSTQASFGLSDRRAKRDIERVGTLFDGTPVYRFTYVGDSSQYQIGVMADEVAPEHVWRDEQTGYSYVDYKAATEASVQRGE